MVLELRVKRLKAKGFKAAEPRFVDDACSKALSAMREQRVRTFDAINQEETDGTKYLRSIREFTPIISRDGFCVDYDEIVSDHLRQNRNDIWPTLFFNPRKVELYEKNDWKVSQGYGVPSGVAIVFTDGCFGPREGVVMHELSHMYLEMRHCLDEGCVMNERSGKSLRYCNDCLDGLPLYERMPVAEAST
ncbi:MAG TPA: hypothetical protein VJH90_01370 [archaeon]|nr:hypothetical protein [archaeon]